MRRSCARPGCSANATATLSYDYAGSTVWLGALGVETHPMTHDLCDQHAEVLSAPRGWVLHDERSVNSELSFGDEAVAG